jgi:Ras-specific guanine nucleotide-releasing factor 1
MGSSEILLFLHQIFYKGLTKKLENWPTLFVGDLFDFLLPVLGIYQEYVRNHHYSLQILTDLKSKSIEFRNLLKRCEEKSRSEVRSLDIFLTYPMHQVKTKNKKHKIRYEKTFLFCCLFETLRSLDTF